MREIKFRAYHKGRKEMYNVHGWHSEYVFSDTLDGIGCDGNPDNIKDVELMQFTGLQDRHGKDIYEGDIMRVTDGNYEITNDCDTGTGMVEFLVNWGLWNVSKIENGLFDLHQNYIIEIIGNIHQNPELI